MQTLTSAKNTSSPTVKANLNSATRRNYLHLLVLLLPAGALAIIYDRLHALPSESFGQLAVGLAVVLCALTGLGVFLWCVRWGVSRDGMPQKNINRRWKVERAKKIPGSQSKELAERRITIPRRETIGAKVGV